MSRAQIFRIPQLDAKSIVSNETLTEYIKERWSDKIKNGDVIWTLDPNNKANARNEGVYMWFKGQVINLDPSKIPCGSDGITSPYHWVDSLSDKFGIFFMTVELRQQISDNMKRLKGTKRYYSWFLLNGIKYPVMINTRIEEDQTANINRVRRSVMDESIPFANRACWPFLVLFHLGESNPSDPSESNDDMLEIQEDFDIEAIPKDFKDMQNNVDKVDKLECASVMYGYF
jgi:hypothetical protein